jgi:hypothetical protein
LNEYEKSFILRTTRLKTAGVDFQELAREALTRKFGGAADVLLRGLSGRALSEPEYFVREMSKTFGRGAMGFFEPIIKYADLGLYGSSQASPILSMLSQLGPAQGAGSDEKHIFLHEQRIKDEEGNYPEDAN